MMIPCRGRDVSTLEYIEVQADAVISHVDPVLGAPPADEIYLAPAFIDLQVNGFAGVDYNAPATPMEEIDRSLRAVFSTGVARCFPTVITAPEEHMLAALRTLARAKRTLEVGGAMEAFHIEGPHISAEDGPRGAHPASAVRPPDLAEFERMQTAAEGNIRIVTLSPEYDEAPAYIEALTRQSVVAAIGHTRASAAQIRDAVSAGATLSTHLGNAGHPVLPKTANYIWDQLAEDRLAASFILDGHHLPDAFVKTALRAKGAERSVLVTDAVAPALASPGLYTIGSISIELRDDGRVVLPGTDRLAGSSLRMDQAISNAMRIGGVSLTAAVAMATSNPARVGRVPGRTRGLQPGQRADMVRFRLEDGHIKVVETWLSGRRVFG